LESTTALLLRNASGPEDSVPVGASGSEDSVPAGASGPENSSPAGDVESQDLAMTTVRVVEHFELGPLLAEPTAVAGGLSNDLWRVTTTRGDFAIKRMVVNARRPEFVDNVEASFRVELHAWAGGVPMPKPIADPASGRALARIGEELYRVHEWVDGRPGSGTAVQAAELLANIHAVGRPRLEVPPDTAWDAGRWGPELTTLANRVHGAPERTITVVDSHRDLDRKNTLLGHDGLLLALDWDAAGPVSAAQEAVSVALDWAGDDRETFAEAIAAYRLQSNNTIKAEPWVFGGWVAALGGWLDYNADHRAGEEMGRAEMATTKARLHAVARDLDGWLEALAG
jgi:hypothetical protein